ncbi:MAG: methyltransferase, TIGR04325 family [Rhodanobacter sp.]
MSKGLFGSVRKVVLDVAELPGVNLLARPIYRHLFARDVLPGNVYGGVFASFDEARAKAPSSLSTSFDQAQSGELYTDRLDNVQIVDYPVLFWLSQLFTIGCRQVFDLGGNVGISYFGFQRYLDYPDDLRWLVHDVPSVVAAGRDRATRYDSARKLAFTESREDANGRNVLLCTGVVQFLDYSVPELLQQLRDPPRHVLINVTPLHPDRSFVTLQRVTRNRVGLANCPYRVTAVGEFIAEFKSAGYDVVDRWESMERYMRIPFEPDYSIDRYYGFYFRRA